MRIILKITLDTNCLIDVEEKRNGYEDILKLKELNEEGIINLKVVAISASEKYINGQKIKNYELFQQFLNSIHFSSLEQLYPFLMWDITFWDRSIWANEEMTSLEKKIHSILFPSISYDYMEYCNLNSVPYPNNELDKKWLNSRCDSIVLWSHIHYQGDLFITRDKNFHKKKKRDQLIQLGAKNILNPKEAIKLFLAE